MLTALIIFSILAITSLGVITILNNARNRINQNFALASIFISLWIIGNYLAENKEAYSLFWTKLAFFGAVGAVCFLGAFVYYFPTESKRKWVLYLNYLTGASLSLLSLTPLLVAGVDIGEGFSNVVPGLLYPLYVLLFLPQAILVVAALFAKYIYYEAERNQIRFVLYGLLGTFLISTTTNLILPLIYNTNEYATAGTTSTVIFSVFTFYAIFKHSLFDIRALVARALAYVLATLFLVVVVISLLLVVTIIIFEESSYSIAEVLSLGIISYIAAVLFLPFRTTFDKLTSRVFYRDAYNTQVEIQKLSNLLNTEYEIDALANKSLGLIGASIKPTSSKIILLNAEGDYYSDYQLNEENRLQSMQAIGTLKNQRSRILLSDENHMSEDEEEPQAVIEYLKKNNIVLSVKLSNADQTVGYVLFGPKLSGSYYSNQDISFLSIVANELSVAIQNARRFDEISRFNETLKLEVDRATRELRDSNEKLQALDKAKDEFVSMASHQLRTPLTSVKGYLSMVLEGDAGKVDKKQRDLLAAAFTSSQRMVYLIADLLNVSRLQTGKFVIEPQLCDLPTVVEGEIDQLKETARAKKLKVKFDKPKKFPLIYIDETKIRQVIMNFIDNAIYYTPAGGEINIKLSADDKKVEYKVIDNGIGVPRAEQKNLFSKFYRATNAKKARPDGTGLGLFMARKVIVDQGGAVIFDSKEGEGSTFGFLFPLTRVRPPKDKMPKTDKIKKATKKKTKKPTVKAKKTSQK